MSNVASSPSGDPLAQATSDVRAAEAARVIGMLDVDGLPARASTWLNAGIRDAVPLAGLDDPLVDPDGSLRGQMLGALAESLGVGFATVGEARAVHAETVIGKMAVAADPTAMITDFSNNFTDDVTAKARERIRGIFRRKK